MPLITHSSTRLPSSSMDDTISRFLVALTRLDEAIDFPHTTLERTVQAEEDVMHILFEMVTKKLIMPRRKGIVIATLLANVMGKLTHCVLRHNYSLPVDSVYLPTTPSATINDARIIRSAVSYLLNVCFTTFRTDDRLRYEASRFHNSISFDEFDRKLRICMKTNGEGTPSIKVTRNHWWWYATYLYE